MNDTIRRYASRAAFLAGVLVVAHLVLGIVAFAGTPTDGTGELVAASERALAYRAYAIVDAVAWLAVGAAFLGLAKLVAGVAPARSTVLYGAGVGSFVGSLGAFVTYHVLPGLAQRWATAGDAAAGAAALTAFHDVAFVALACFNAGQVAWLAGFLTVGSLARNGVLPAGATTRWASTVAVVGIVGLIGVTLAHRLDILMPVVLPTAIAIAVVFFAAGAALGRSGDGTHTVTEEGGARA